MEDLLELFGCGEKPKFNRRLARDIAFKYIFAWSYDEEDIPDIAPRLDEMAFRENDRAYILKAFEGVTKGRNELDGIISEKTRGWKKERLSKVCLAGVRLGLYEILHMDDIPLSVTINEIVEIIKTYDSPEAGGYANGIMGGFSEGDKKNDSGN